MRNLKFGYLKLRNGNSEKTKFGDFVKLRVDDSPYVKENKQKKNKKKNNNNRFLNKQKATI